MTALLDRIPWIIIWWVNHHLNHAGKYCISTRFCDYAGLRAAGPELEQLRPRK